MSDGVPYRADCPACVVKRFWFEQLHFCGCGVQGGVIGIFRDAMQIMHHRSAAIDDEGAWMAGYEKLKNLLGGDDNPFYYLVMYTLDAHDLTEHGGSVGGSWLSDKGRALLAGMANKTNDELDKMLQHDEFEHEAQQ